MHHSVGTWPPRWPGMIEADPTPGSRVALGNLNSDDVTFFPQSQESLFTIRYSLVIIPGVCIHARASAA